MAILLKYIRAVFVCVLIVTSGIAKVAADTITIGILTNSGAQRSFYTGFAERFEEAHPNIQVKLDFKPDAEFKAALSGWFADGRGPDVINWQGGERLFQYVRQGHVSSISELWEQESLLAKFSTGAVGAVTYDEKQYAIPISYYQWGFYYRESVFKKLNLQAPKTWEEFLKICETLKNNNIVPITVGAKYKWPTAAWFDYLNLRINGLAFHQALLKGEVSFLEKRVKSVFEKWKLLLDKGYFVQQYGRWKWDEAMPFLYHKMAGMTLIGNFFTSNMPESLTSDFRYFPFPQLDATVPFFEEAPLDVFMLPTYAENNSSAKLFLKAIADSKFQSNFNEKMGMIAPNVTVSNVSNYFIEEGRAVLNRAQGVSQFFDRDTNAEMSSAAMDIFTQFVGHKDVERAINELERARIEFLL